MASDKGPISFETGRIQALQAERQKTQKKTFTKWVNSYLEKVNLHINDLFADFEDGKRLLKLLELISGDQMGKANPGRMRLQKIENVNKALMFLSSKVRLESIGAEDIVDGNPRLILGLMWTIILRFEIQEIKLEDDSSETRSAKEALLLWCQRKTAGYKGVEVRNFTTSWRSGLAFNALIHAHRPDIIDYTRLQKESNMNRLNNAFDIAHSRLGIHKFLDAEDIDIERPDEKSVLTYVSAYYHYFAKMKTEKTGGKRIAKIVGQLQVIHELECQYETLVTNLLDWINKNIGSLMDHSFPNSLSGIQEEMMRFKNFRIEEKPPKYKERGNIEAIWFDIQTKAHACKRKSYMPPDGKLISDIEKAWEKLEKAEHGREVAMREELIRQERLERLVEKFERKALLRETWIFDIMTVIKESIVPSSDVRMLDAATKRHEAITADILSRKERFEDLTKMAKELIKENYKNAKEISDREREICRKWQELMDLLTERQQALQGFSDVMGLFRDIDIIMTEMKEMEVSLQSGDCGKHLLAVEHLLEKHSLAEVQIKSQEHRIQQINQQADDHIQTKRPESKAIKEKVLKLNLLHQSIKESSSIRREKLEKTCKYFQFVRDSEEEDLWLMEKQRMAKSMVTGRDYTAVMNLKQKHASLEVEIAGHKPILQSVMLVGAELIRRNHPSKKQIQTRIKDLQEKEKMLHEYSEARKVRLEEARESHQYYIDANEADSWVREKMPLVCSDDYGKDPASAKTLLQKHLALEEEIKAYESDLLKLKEQAGEMISSYAKKQSEVDENKNEENGSKGEYIEVPYEVEEEEVVEKEIIKEVIEERSYPQVKAMFPYKAHGLDVCKGEVMILMEKSNKDWWHVRISSSKQGFIPANYVKEVEKKVVHKKVKRKVRVPETVKVVKTKMKREFVPSKRRPSQMKRQSQFDKDNIESRQVAIEGTYRRLKKLAVSRRKYLEDAIKLFTFYRECNEFEDWIKEKEKVLKKKESFSENIDIILRKFDQLITDLSANQGRIERINKMADEFVAKGHSKQTEVRGRQKKVNDQWEMLMRLKDDKEKLLEGASSIELYNQTWGETKEWIMEKFHTLSQDDPGMQTQSIENLQRKHENLERELEPVKDKLRKLGLLATAVKTSYPGEIEHINNKQDKIRELWDSLEEKTTQKKVQLEQVRDISQFHQDTKSLMDWASEVRAQLLEAEVEKDIQGSEDLLKKHLELLTDIEGQQPRLEETCCLGKKLLKSLPDSYTIDAKVKKLQETEQDLLSIWDKKNKQLEDALDLAIFNKEADQIEAASTGHEAFLELEDIGSTVQEVDAVLKRHRSFRNSLALQEEKFKSLHNMSGSLKDKEHNSKNYIGSRYEELDERRNHLMEKADCRENKLVEIKKYLEFCRDAEEMQSWISEKMEDARSKSYLDPVNLPRKLKKHEAFEAEFAANHERLEKWRKTGESLIDSENHKSSDIETLLTKMNQQWSELRKESKEKGTKLTQAVHERDFIRSVEDVNTALNDIQYELKSTDTGQDLRGVKHLIKKQQNLESEVIATEGKVQDILLNCERLKEENHFNAAKLSEETRELVHRYESILEPMKERKQVLEEALKFQNFNQAIDCEQQWIKERSLATSSLECGKDYLTTQKMIQKHAKLSKELSNHESSIQKMIKVGESLIEGKHFASSEVRESCQDLSLAWAELMDQSMDRQDRLKMAFDAQQFYVDANEAESWMMEKMNVVNSHEMGKDETATSKLLTRSKAIEEEIKNYESVIDELQSRVDVLASTGNPEAEKILQMKKHLDDQLIGLANQTSTWQDNLEQTKLMHQYVRDSDELGEWIEEKYAVATSVEYGQDLEHLQVLMDNFEHFKKGVESGLEQFGHCEDQIEELKSRGYPVEDVLLEKEDSLKQALQMLMEQVLSREQKLQAASQIHKFTCDVDDISSRIQEKYSSIPDDLGKDVHSVQALLRKHDTFTSDLVALERQVQAVIDSVSYLEDEYPGMYTEQLEEQQEAVVSNWNILQKRTTERQQALEAAQDYQKFLSFCRDLTNWASEVNVDMATNDHVRDVASAQAMIEQHNQTQAEIVAREDNFVSLEQAGQMLIQSQHYGSEEVKEKLEAVLSTKELLKTNWEAKKEYLEQQKDQQIFNRDMQQLHTLTNQHEVLLSNCELGETSHEVEAQIKKHEAFGKVLNAHEEKSQALQELAERLIAKEHFDSHTIKQKLQQVLERRRQIRDLSQERRHRLSIAKLYSQFQESMTEAKAVISEKRKIIQDDSFLKTSNLQEKLKKLKKHQAFEAELNTNKKVIEDIQETGQKLIQMKHQDNMIQTQIEQVVSDWMELCNASADRGKHLAEVKDLLEFQRQTEKVESWLKEKELMVSAADLGNDYEHCLELQQKLCDIGSDKSVNDSVIRNISDIAEKLITEAKDKNVEVIARKKSEIQDNYTKVQAELQTYQVQLSSALEIHAFKREVDEQQERMHEKELVMSSEELGKDLKGVEALLRRHEDLLQDISPIQNKLQELEKTGTLLIKRYPEKQSELLSALDEVKNQWNNLQSTSTQRQTNLKDSYQLQKFYRDAREMNAWSEEVIHKMTSLPLAKNVTDAENLCELHKETKAEIDGRAKTIKAIQEFGESLTSRDHYASENIQENLGSTYEMYQQVLDTWEEKKVIFAQCFDLQVFQDFVEQSETWLSSKEVSLANQDSGETLTSTEALHKKHEAFEQTLISQMDKIDELEVFGDELLSNDHFEKEYIASKLIEIMQRRESLYTVSAKRKKHLSESKQYHQFIQSLQEMMLWIREKLLLVGDQSYEDLTNLQRKIQKHQSQHAEILANRQRLDTLQKEGQALIFQAHPTTEHISEQLEQLQAKWDELIEACNDKKLKLDEAYKALVFQRMLDDVELWLQEVNSQLESQDFGKDLKSVKKLLKKHQALESQTSVHQEKILQASKSAELFKMERNLVANQLSERYEEMASRFESLQKPSFERLSKLTDSLKFHQFLRDIEDELAWISGKVLLMNSKEVGGDLNTIRNYCKKHKALMSEVENHEAMMTSVTHNGKDLLESNHFASSDVRHHVTELTNQWKELRELSAKRDKSLQEALLWHTYLSDADEAMAWLEEKQLLVISKDLGKDEDSVQSLLKSLDALDLDLQTFGKNSVDNLREKSQILLNDGHSKEKDNNIKIKMAELGEYYQRLVSAFQERRALLADRKTLFEFCREVEEVLEWIHEKMQMATSEDYGQDLEHVEILQNKFGDFVLSITAFTTHVDSLLQKGEDLMRHGIGEKSTIEEQCQMVQIEWEQLKESTTIRTQSLEDAKLVHSFTRDAEEARSWIQEKDSSISHQEYGEDLGSVQALIRKHQGFQRDLAALEEKVSSISQDASLLVDQFPDAFDVISEENEKVVQAWDALLEKASLRKEKLEQIHQLKLYFTTYEELSGWIVEMQVRINSYETPHDVSSAEALITRHTECRAEIEAQSDRIIHFTDNGKHLIQQEHLQSLEITTKIENLSESWELLLNTWTKQQELFDSYLETQLYLRELEQAEAWMNSRDALLHNDEFLNESVDIDELLKKHEDLEKLIQAQDEKIDALKRPVIKEKQGGHFEDDSGKALNNHESAREIPSQDPIQPRPPGSNGHPKGQETLYAKTGTKITQPVSKEYLGNIRGPEPRLPPVEFDNVLLVKGPPELAEPEVTEIDDILGDDEDDEFITGILDE